MDTALPQKFPFILETDKKIYFLYMNLKVNFNEDKFLNPLYDSLSPLQQTNRVFPPGQCESDRGTVIFEKSTARVLRGAEETQYPVPNERGITEVRGGGGGGVRDRPYCMAVIEEIVVRSTGVP